MSSIIQSSYKNRARVLNMFFFNYYSNSLMKVERNRNFFFLPILVHHSDTGKPRQHMTQKNWNALPFYRVTPRFFDLTYLVERAGLFFSSNTSYKMVNEPNIFLSFFYGRDLLWFFQGLATFWQNVKAWQLPATSFLFPNIVYRKEDDERLILFHIGLSTLTFGDCWNLLRLHVGFFFA